MTSIQTSSISSKVASAFPEDFIFPPNEIDSKESLFETETHLRQFLLFLSCLEWFWKDRTDYYATGNLTVYYSVKQLDSEYEDFRAPDFFVALGTKKKLRRSWVVWEENGKYPNVIIEVLSKLTENADRTTKKKLYQDTFRAPDYFLFDPNRLELVGYHLVSGKYKDLEPNDRGHLWSQQLQLYLGLHENFVRFFTPEGKLVPTPEEDAEKLAAKLRELNIDPDTV